MAIQTYNPATPFSVPSGLFNYYASLMDGVINFASVPCTLIFPDKKIQCENCILDNNLGVSSNQYRPGGPYPFTIGICSFCGGKGFTNQETTQTLSLIVYHNPKQFENVNVRLEIPKGSIQIKTYYTNVPLLRQAQRLRVSQDIEGIYPLTYEKLTEPEPNGFSNRFCLQVWKPI